MIIVQEGWYSFSPVANLALRLLVIVSEQLSRILRPFQLCTNELWSLLLNVIVVLAYTYIGCKKYSRRREVKINQVSI